MPLEDPKAHHRAWAGALVLLSAALFALVAANSPLGPAYQRLWDTSYRLPFGIVASLHGVVDKGLMTAFFLVVGLDLKREARHGALRHPRAMALPLIAALAGMIAPALIYHALNAGPSTANGWAIPMSTDVAFAAGVLALLGRRAPRNLLIFLLALAIVDDIAAVLVIALYYTRHWRPWALVAVFAVATVLFVPSWRRARGLPSYLGLGAILWWALGRAGIDPPLAGVVLAAAIPSSAPGASDGASARLERRLAPYVTFGVLPLFALANSALVLARADFTARTSVFLGVFLGLLLGKFAGVGGASWLALRTRLAHPPTGVTFRHILGAAWLSGIGFTMALFINTLAFTPGPARDAAKLGVLLASSTAAVLGGLWLAREARKP